MEYQQLPPVSMIIGTPNAAPHLHSMNGANNNANGNSNHISSNQLLTMQPPLLPLQVAHNLHQLTTHNSQANSVHHGNQNQSSQSLPPTAQLLQAIHNNTQQQQQQQNNGQNMSSNTNGTTNNTNNPPTDENNRWTQYQVQQLWRHHAYLNGNVRMTTAVLHGKWIRAPPIIKHT